MSSSRPIHTTGDKRERRLFLCLLFVAGIPLSVLAQGPDVKIEFETPPAPPSPPPPTIVQDEEAAKRLSPAGEVESSGQRSAPAVTGRALLERAAEELLHRDGSAAEATPKVAPEKTAPGGPKAEAATPPGPDRSAEQAPAFTGGTDAPQNVPPEQIRPAYEGPSFFRMIFGLAVVLGGVVGVLYLVRRFYYGRLASGASSGVMEVLAREYVEPGRSLLLVRVGGRLLVLGSTREGLRKVAEISDKEEVEEILRRVGQDARRNAFADILKAADRRPDAARSIDLTDEETA